MLQMGGVGRILQAQLECCYKEEEEEGEERWVLGKEQPFPICFVELPMK